MLNSSGLSAAETDFFRRRFFEFQFRHTMALVTPESPHFRQTRLNIGSEPAGSRAGSRRGAATDTEARAPP